MTEHRFYGDLAPWWPLISPAEQYAEEAAFAATLLGDDTRTVLELGSGGGHMAVHLKKQFEITLVDLAPGMLEQSRKINPELPHHQGDMRDVRLGRTFDAVFIHDAIGYMITEDDLRRALETAAVHASKVVIIPDATTEIFEPDTDHGGVDGDDGRAARYLSWTYAGDGNTVKTDYAFLLREADAGAGTDVTVAHETHVNGLFPRDTWLRLLRQQGFKTADAVTEETSDGRTPRICFVARKTD
ncbi:methyltransferase family protein [Asanoa ferruginea]|uniref:Methyltransferase family protein n=1 Tax=Asanoa ferruginea TaxID=53367 RepID=A0A3D9ZMS9_9ACTN|nr:class I SAM-dependent methyltransferase [Asanoa ferruginea]REF98179.1 methyltransferase family protein [Asanoa ferruginea]GIF50853.1 hypothetical protein Afe04nite_53920 [Asanoa ferruginea]